MRNLHKFIEENHGLEALQALHEWEMRVIKDSDYRNHRRFTFRCTSKGIILVSVRLKSTSNNRRRTDREIIYRVEKQLLQDMVKCISGILCDNEGKLDRNRSRLLSLVTTTTAKDRCIVLINKVRESRFTKIKNRQVNKFNRLATKSGKGREANTYCRNISNQSQASNSNSNQLQASGSNNKWVINLSNTPLTQAQESFLS